jgi:hypothetical protein
MCIGVYVKCPLFLSDWKQPWILWTDFSKNSEISNFIKIAPVRARFFVRTEGRAWRSLYSPFAILRTRLKKYFCVCSQYCGGLVHPQPADVTTSSLLLPFKCELTYVLVHKDVNDSESSQQTTEFSWFWQKASCRESHGPPPFHILHFMSKHFVSAFRKTRRIHFETSVDC